MKIYTRGGDGGQTSLLGGARKSKFNIRIQAYGAVDELNSHIGLLADQEVNRSRAPFLRDIQRALFTIGSQLAASPDFPKDRLPEFASGLDAELEQAIDHMDSRLPELRSFVLPGGHPSVSFCHIARTVARRAERMVVALQEQEVVEVKIITYLNRLSDYLFVLARMMALELGVQEVPWKPARKD
jgi:cob(I)alamin adenosyltransferase